MCGTMNVQVEVWAVAADTRGIWLVNGGDAWLSAPIPQDSDPHFEVEIVLRRHALSADDVRMLHSTSWRADGPHVILTYIAVVDRSGIVVTHWPQALPLGDELLTVVGPPPPIRLTRRLCPATSMYSHTRSVTYASSRITTPQLAQRCRPRWQST